MGPKITPYNQYSDYLKRIYGTRIQKITVLGGFTCPNRDGTKGLNGCTYCNNHSFAPPDFLLDLSITEQVDHGIKVSKKRYKNCDKYIIYFQSYSNTYAPLPKLIQVYEEALAHPKVIGLSIGTRPDCIDDAKLDYLQQLATNYDITIEYGLESISNQTLEKIERGHDFETFLNAVNKTKGRGIKICSHLIFGFPWEDLNHYLKTAEVLSSLEIDFLKIHQLHVVKNTQMGDQYLNAPFPLFSLDEYMDIIIRFLEQLNPDIVIQRLLGDCPPHLLLSPSWDLTTSEFLLKLGKIMLEKNIWQGKLYSPIME